MPTIDLTSDLKQVDSRQDANPKLNGHSQVVILNGNDNEMSVIGEKANDSSSGFGLLETTMVNDQRVNGFGHEVIINYEVYSLYACLIKSIRVMNCEKKELNF
jgi:hypothetical protein